MATRWGIISAGKIANDFVTSLKVLPKDEHTVIGVAARSKERAGEFATKHGIPFSYDSYDDLLDNKDIEVVYIGVIHPHHFGAAMKSLEKGKHVLCEKPLCMNQKETKLLIECAKKKNLFLMEAVWSRCFPVYEHLRKLLLNKSIGDVLHLDAQFGAKIDVERMWKKELGGGTILDIGIYTLQIATLVFGSSPSKVVAAGHLNKEGVDESMTCVLTYPSGASAVLSTHSRVFLSNAVHIDGTLGSVTIHAPFWSPTKITVKKQTGVLTSEVVEEQVYALPQTTDTFNFTNGVGMHYEAAEVRRCLKEGVKESPLMTHEDSISLAVLEDEIRRQLGVHYPQDGL